MRLTTIGKVAIIALAVLAGCGSADDGGAPATAAPSNFTAAPSSAPATGTYTRVATPDGRTGTLVISAASADSVTFDVTATATIPPGEDPHETGTHEGGTNGVAKADAAGFTFKQDQCVLHLSVSNVAGKPRISVKQDEDTICEPDPFVSLDGDYDLGAPTPSAPPKGTYDLTKGQDGRTGELVLSAVSADSLTFQVTGHATIDAEEDPHEAGTHEGGTNGVAKADGAGFTFKEDDCVLHFTVSTSGAKPRITVKQDENTICEPDPFVSLDGDYDLASAAK